MPMLDAQGPIPPHMLMLAYRAGVFPMADSRDDPELYWVEPRKRGILPLDGFHCSHSLARTLRRGHFTVTCNAAFDAVIDACAGPRRGAYGEDTWISERIAASYRQLHLLGHAHSIEVWRAAPDAEPRELVGGLYGVGFDRVFCGESMFSRATDTSKVALAWLVAAMKRGDFTLLDCQMQTDHLASLGAIEISQAQYQRMLATAQDLHPGGETPSADDPPMARRVPRQLTSPASPSLGAPGAGAGGGVTSSAEPASLALPAAFAALLEDAKSAGFSSSPGKLIAQSLTQTS